jgi:hypothetical protein
MLQQFPYFSSQLVGPTMPHHLIISSPKSCICSGVEAGGGIEWVPLRLHLALLVHKPPEMGHTWGMGGSPSDTQSTLRPGGLTPTTVYPPQQFLIYLAASVFSVEAGI